MTPMAWRESHPHHDIGGPPAVSGWALAVIALAVYVPLLRSGLTVFDPSGPLAVAPGAPLPVVALRIAGVLLHGLSAALVYLAGRTLLGEPAPALLAAVLFALHPVHVDAVARVGALTELAGSAGLLAGVWFALRFFRSAGGRAALLAAAGLVWSALSAALARAQWQESTFVGNPLLGAPPGVRFMTAVQVFGRYLKLMVWPYRLSPDYSYNSVPVVSHPLSPAFLLPLAVVAALAAAAVLRRHRRPLYGIAGVFFLVSAFPLWPMIDPRVPLMAERTVYLPSAALCWAAAQWFRDAGWLARPDWHNARSVKSLALIVICLLVPWAAKVVPAGTPVGRSECAPGCGGTDGARQRAGAAAARRRLTCATVIGRRRRGHTAGRWVSTRNTRPRQSTSRRHTARAASTRTRWPHCRRPRQPTRACRWSAWRNSAAYTWPGTTTRRRRRPMKAPWRCDDSDARLHLEVGTLYLQLLGQPERGRLHLRRSLELDPGQPRAGEIREVLGRR